MDAPKWLDRWDRQQEVYIEQRERAFEVVLRFIDVLTPGPITVLDLGAGPGSLSRRILDHRPDAHCVALDTDPVLQTIGIRALGTQGGRLRWVLADLRDPGWTRSLEDVVFDAVVSSTATHWLCPDQLARVYRQVFQLLRPGGILLNADSMYYPAQQTGIRAAVDAEDGKRQARALAEGTEDWQGWWDALRREPGLEDAFADREAAFLAYPVSDRFTRPTRAFHETAALAAGFAEVATVWQDLHKHVLLALR